MTDNLPKKDKLEIISENRAVDMLRTPDYRYGFDQEPLDSRTLRNKGTGDKKQLGNNIVYYADQSGVVTATAILASTTSITGYNGLQPSMGGAEIVAYGEINGSIETSAAPNITFRVNKGTYYRVAATSGVYIAYFTPLY